MYSGTTEASFDHSQDPVAFQKLSFVLAFFHSVLLERRRFKSLGFNLQYEFSDADFQVEPLVYVFVPDSRGPSCWMSKVTWFTLVYLLTSAYNTHTLFAYNTLLTNT